MNANARLIKQQKVSLPTLDDLAKGLISLDDYEIAHGEDVPELTAKDFARARAMKEMFPEIIEAFARMRGMRGAQKAPPKERIGLRLDADVVAHFRATGAGWQARVNDILKQHMLGNDRK